MAWYGPCKQPIDYKTCVCVRAYVCVCVPSQRYGQTVANIDKDAKTVTLSDGKTIQYNSLLSTLPLDIVLRWLGKPEWADGLQHSSSHIVGIGIRGHSPHGTKCWLYYPEDDCPYYRYAVCFYTLPMCASE